MSRNVPKQKWETWEKEAVARGEVPEGRPYRQAASYAHAHGIAWKDVRAGVCKWWWKPEEEAIIAKGEIPPNRSWDAIRQHKKKMGIPNASHPLRSDYLASREI